MLKHTLMSIAVILILTACTSLVEKGNKLYEQGMYQQAAEFYERALKKDPNDIEAKAALTNTRNKIIDRGLIEVRMLRLAANFNGAAKKLETILRNQSKWNLESMGAQAASQNEELREVKTWLLKEAELLGTTAKPDQFRWFEHEFSYLIANAQLADTFIQYKSSIEEKAQQQCTLLSQQVKGQRFYLKQFTEKYCAAWQQFPTLVTAQQDKSRYTKLNIIDKVTLSTPQYRSQQSEIERAISEFENQFVQSVFYSERANKALNLTLKVNVNYNRDTVYRQKEKHYVVKKKQPDPNNKDKQIEVDVERIYAYQITEYFERYNALVKYQTEINGTPLSNSESINERNTTQSHNFSHRKASVYPQSPNFMDQNAQLRSSIKDLLSQFSADLKGQWKRQYCERAIHKHMAENVLRCAAVDGNNRFVNTWFEQQFGIDYTAMKVLYGI